MTEELEALDQRIREGITRQGRYLVTAPAEMAQLGDLDAVHHHASEQGWIFVPHLGGEFYEFFEATRSPQQELY